MFYVLCSMIYVYDNAKLFKKKTKIRMKEKKPKIELEFVLM